MNSGDAGVAQCRDEFVYTAPGGRFSANPFGLKDVHGNAWSWTEDCFVDSYKNAPRDGSAVTTGDCIFRVLRGGSWNNNQRDLRSAFRNVYRPGDRNDDLGFRLARTLNP